jgi:transposase
MLKKVTANHVKTMSPKDLLDRRVRMRLRWIEHYEQVTKKVSPTCRYFGITRTTFYRWYHRYMSLGLEGLKDRSCRPHRINYYVIVLERIEGRPARLGPIKKVTSSGISGTMRMRLAYC